MATSARSVAAPSTALRLAQPDPRPVSSVFAPGSAAAISTTLLHVPRAPSTSAATPHLDTPPVLAAALLPTSLSNPLSRIVTPLVVDEWERQLAAAGLSDFSTIPAGLRHGFDVGLDRVSTLARFSASERFTLYDNHKSAVRYPSVISANLEEEKAEGRISDFYAPEDLYALVGPFRNAPLTVAAKDGDFAKGRVCQDFSHPRDSAEDPSFNAQLDMDAFTCDWGTFSQCYLLAASAPQGAQVAVFDVKAAHRRVPVLPWQQCFYAIYWQGLVALNYCCQFGAASSSGLWGRLADAFRALFKFSFPGCDSINWADDFTFWRYPLASGDYSISEDDIYAFADRLGWPWSKKKTKDFSHRFAYLGFTWDLREKTVEVTDAKKSKYIAALEPWVPGFKCTRSDVQSLLGKLVHCSLVLPEGRSRLPALSRFCAAFADGDRYARFRLPDNIAADLQWWRSALGAMFCGMRVREVPPPLDIDFFVDASTGWGIGLVLNGSWDYWRLREGWKSKGRDIGWAEMVAVELGLRALVERGYSGVHVKLRSDNKGVVGALDAGKSRSVQSNRVLQRIVACMLDNDLWLSVEWVASEDNPADEPSRGIPAVGRVRHVHAFRLPFLLREFVDKQD